MIVGVWVRLRAHQLILRNPEIYSRILTSVTLKRFELVIIGKSTQSLTTEPSPIVLTLVVIINFNLKQNNQGEIHARLEISLICKLNYFHLTSTKFILIESPTIIKG